MKAYNTKVILHFDWFIFLVLNVRKNSIWLDFCQFFFLKCDKQYFYTAFSISASMIFVM